MRNYDLEVPISNNNHSLKKDDNKCITCGWCKKVCTNDITIAKMFEYNPNYEPICIDCGQCSNACPTEAIHEKFDYLKIKRLLHNKKDKTIIFGISPSVSISLPEEFSLSTDIENKIPTALKQLGADYVFDLSVATDIYIMEESTELVNRIKNNGILPQISSHCPSWIKYCEIFYPHLIPNLSTTKSNNLIFSTIIKTYFAKKINIDPKNIINILVTSCTAKKDQIRRKKTNYTPWDTDYILTTRELAMLLKEEKINLAALEDSQYKNHLVTASQSNILHDINGGITESIIKTVGYLLTNKDFLIDSSIITNIRSTSSVKEIEIKISGKTIKIAICNGIKNAVELIDKLQKKEVYYDYIEVTCCQGGCINGGGNPKITLLNMKDTKTKRANNLYDKLDKANSLSYQNTEINSIYNEFLNEKLLKKLLHTKYYDKSFLLRGEKND